MNIANKIMITEEQMIENYNKLKSYVNGFTNIERKEKILKLYGELEENIIKAPASSFLHFHGCYPGGYVNHILKVIEFSAKMYKMWEKNGNDMSGYTFEELIFSAKFHDLGKVCDENKEDYYILNPDEWSVNKTGKMFIRNPKCKVMPIPDRSIFLLQHHGIQISSNEFRAIKCHDGLFDDANKPYYSTWDKDGLPDCNLIYILSESDIWAYRWELEHEYLKYKNQ